ncbi:HlyD family secretion protein [Novipirellula galeiformis]|uniref:HlyD family secretion protein n=2 Tax=Novipirellula galeiformis TaxID=2528004 RepID=A0A5C6CIB0_9BACT|nr:HlyD family secretion protein [Novipirellula galeiformis]
MNPMYTSLPPEPENTPLDRFQDRFEYLGRLARQPISTAEFSQALLNCLVRDIRARRSRVWQSEQGHWHQIAIAGEPPGGSNDSEITPGSASATGPAPVAGSASATLSSDATGVGKCERVMAEDGSVWLSLSIAQVATQAPSIVLQAALLPALTNDAHQARAKEIDAAAELLQAYGLLFEDHLGHQMILRLQTALSSEHQLRTFSDSIHSSVDLHRTAMAIVAATVTATRCQRASVTIHSTSGRSSSPNRNLDQRVLAVSGVSTLDPRSPPVRKLAKLASIVATLKKPLIHDGQDHDLPPQAMEALDAHLDESHLGCLLALPLELLRSTADVDATLESESEGLAMPSGAPVGVLLLEFANPSALHSAAPTATKLTATAAVALRNAAIHSRLPFRRVLSGLRSMTERRGLAGVHRIVWATLAFVFIASALMLIPAELTIESTGTLQPAVVRGCFAPRDGNIDDVLVQHNQTVASGDTLLQMHSPDLELELRRIEGAVESTKKQLIAAESARRRNLNGSSSGRRDSRDGVGSDSGGNHLAAEETQLQATLDSYLEQLSLLRGERDRLAIKSPLDGVVLTWQVEQTLRGRPVRRGQQLLRIAAADSPWILKLELPDGGAGHVQNARRELKRELDVEYVIASHPQDRLHGKIINVAQITSMSDEGPVVEVIAAIDSPPQGLLRAGTQVRGQIHCGQHALGYVWFHELWDAICLHLFF